MMARDWWDESWNPTRGCSPTSPGCRRCYAERLAHRMSGPGRAYEGLTTLRKGSPRWTGEVVTVPDMLNMPRRWNKPREIFVDSMSDLFHPKVPDGFIMDVWRIMSICYWHTFIIVTKRADRMLDWVTRWAHVDEPSDEPKLARGPSEIRKEHSTGRAHLFADMLETWGNPPSGAAYPTYDWMEGMRWLPAVLPHVVLAVSVENQTYADERVPRLLQTPAACRVISAEPLLERTDLRQYLGRNLDQLRNLTNPGFPPRIDGVICGGESGPGSEVIALEHARDMRDQCAKTGTAFMFKQWGGFPKGKNGRVLDGRTHDELAWRQVA